MALECYATYTLPCKYMRYWNEEWRKERGCPRVRVRGRVRFARRYGSVTLVGAMFNQRHCNNVSPTEMVYVVASVRSRGKVRRGGGAIRKWPGAFMSSYLCF
jgi:hypothetical protein